MSDVAINLQVNEPKRARLVLGDEPELRLKALGGGGIPEYEGSYSVTPSLQPQTLETAGKRLSQDVEVAAVPTTTVSTTSSEGFHEVPGGGFEWRYRPNAVVGTSGWASAGTVNGQWRNFNAIRKDTHITPSSSTQTIGGGGYMLQDKIYVDPIPLTPYGFLGLAAEKLGDIYTADYTLDETGFATWTPSTTAAAIVAAKTLTDTLAADMDAYEYYLRWKFDADVAYKSGTTMKYTTTRELEELWQVIAKRPSSLDNVASDSFNGNNCSTYFTAGLTVYNNSSGVETYTWSASYGLYLSATAATFSNSTSDTPTVTIKTPAINARCSGTYFSTARAVDVDQPNTKLALRGELWRVSKDSSPSRDMYGYLVDIYNSPLTS